MYDNQQPQYRVVGQGLTPTFFGRVMTYFGLAILTSALGMYLTMQFFIEYFFQYPALQFVFYAIELGLIFTSRYWSQKVPLNRILFVLFAALTGVTIAPLITILLASPAGASLLVKALAATVFMFLATGIYGYTTKRDLSGMGGFLTITLFGMIGVGILGIFFPWGNTMELIYSGIGILLFSGFTMYDMQKLKHYPQDQHIEAALGLYLDIFNLFLMILRFMMAFLGRE